MNHTLRIRLFAQFREKLGQDFWEMTISGPITVHQLRSRLSEEMPDQKALLSFSHIAVNQEFAGGDAIIGPTDDIAIIPPVSGGSGSV